MLNRYRRAAYRTLLALAVVLGMFFLVSLYAALGTLLRAPYADASTAWSELALGIS